MIWHSHLIVGGSLAGREQPSVCRAALQQQLQQRANMPLKLIHKCRIAGHSVVVGQLKERITLLIELKDAILAATVGQVGAPPRAIWALRRVEQPEQVASYQRVDGLP